MCRQNLYASLRERGQGRTPLRAHDAVCLSIDAQEAGERLNRACPMLCRLIIQVVSHGPDAEIGIVCNEWNGGRAQIGSRGHPCKLEGKEYKDYSCAQ